MPIHIKLSRIPSWILRGKKSVSFSHKFTVIINFCSLIFLSFFPLYSMLGIKPLSLSRVVCKKMQFEHFLCFYFFSLCLWIFFFLWTYFFSRICLKRRIVYKVYCSFLLKGKKKKKNFLPFQFCKDQVRSQCSCRPVVHLEITQNKAFCPLGKQEKQTLT